LEVVGGPIDYDLSINEALLQKNGGLGAAPEGRKIASRDSHHAVDAKQNFGKSSPKGEIQISSN
jgi:hypothetical protein